MALIYGYIQASKGLYARQNELYLIKIKNNDYEKNNLPHFGIDSIWM